MSDPIRTAALKWDRLRREAKRLGDERNSLVCEHEIKDRPPCWKNWDTVENHTTGMTRDELLPREEWCYPCRRRQRVHEEYSEATKARGAALRSLQMLCGRAQA